MTFGKSGGASAPIVLMNYGTDAPVIDGNGTTGSVVDLSNRSHVRIIGFEVKNASNGDPSIGINVQGSGTDIVIKNCKVHDIASADKNAHGIAVYGTSGSTPISNIVIDGNEVYNCKLGQSESVALNGNIDSFTIIRNTIHDNDNIGIDMIGWEVDRAQQRPGAKRRSASTTMCITSAAGPTRRTAANGRRTAFTSTAGRTSSLTAISLIAATAASKSAANTREKSSAASRSETTSYRGRIRATS